MGAYRTDAIRNLALFGHAASGKTTLAESLLYRMGVIGKPGTIERGDTVSDFTEEEQEHGHSFFNAVLHGDYRDTHINLIDTPGSPDFLGQAIGAVPAVETLAITVNAATGIEPLTRRIMQLAQERNLCRMLVVTRMDAAGADLGTLVQQIQESFGKQCLPINLPANGGRDVVDCFFNREGESDIGSVSDAHTAIIDQVVEVDEALMSTYLEQGEVSPDQLHEPFEKALRDGHLVPICFTAARPHEGGEAPIGVDALLDLLVKLAPNPKEGNPRPFIRGEDEANPLYPVPEADQHALAHCFSIRMDPFAGKLSMFRVHQGTITPQSQLYIGDPKEGESKRPFKVTHLFKLQGGKHLEMDQAIPGDLAAVAKVDDIHFDAVLHDSHDEDALHLRPLPFPEPMTGLAIQPSRRGDESKLAEALNKLQEEDPTFRVVRDASTKQTVIYGLGDLHLRVELEKLEHRYGLTVETSKPKIAYRETIQGKAEGHHRHKKQTGGAGQFGEVYLRIEPTERGEGFEFVDEIVGGTIPNQFIPAVQKGVVEAMTEGALAGYPIQDVRVRVYDGKHHPVDSKEVAFVAAGKKAFIDAFHKANPILLEPMAMLEITVPEDAMGDITSDLTSRRGRVQGTDMLGAGQALISAVVPLSELDNYQGQLKSVTGGQGTFSMEFSHYDPMPGHVQQQIINQSQPVHQEA
jgi:elongation factor G